MFRAVLQLLMNGSVSNGDYSDKIFASISIFFFLFVCLFGTFFWVIRFLNWTKVPPSLLDISRYDLFQMTYYNIEVVIKDIVSC